MTVLVTGAGDGSDSTALFSARAFALALYSLWYRRRRLAGFEYLRCLSVRQRQTMACMMAATVPIGGRKSQAARLRQIDCHEAPSR